CLDCVHCSQFSPFTHCEERIMRSKLAIIGLSALAALAIACGVGSGETESTVDGQPQGDGVETPQGPATAALGQTVTLSSEFLGDNTAVEVTLSDAQQHATDTLGLSPDNGV